MGGKKLLEVGSFAPHAGDGASFAVGTWPGLVAAGTVVDEAF